MSNEIIAISGLKGSGKNEASNMLHFLLTVPKWMRCYWIYKFNFRWEKKWHITSFASTLKLMLSSLLKVPVYKFEDRDFKENYCIDFNSMKIIHKKDVPKDKLLSDHKFSKLNILADSIYNNYYLTIRQLMQSFGTQLMRSYFGDDIWIKSTLTSYFDDNLIISDLRFKIEYEHIKKYGGKIIYINRPECVPGNHASEREVVELLNDNKFDYIVDNSGDLPTLFDNLKKVVWNLEKQH